MAFLKEFKEDISEHKTINQLFNEGVEMITKLYTPSSRETVNFGKYGFLTYREVRRQHPAYCEWIVKTAKESDSPHWRLVRLAHWLTSDPDAAESGEELWQDLEEHALRSPDKMSMTSAGSASQQEISELKAMVKQLTKNSTSSGQASASATPTEELKEAKEMIQKLEMEKTKLEHELLASSGRGKTRRET